MFAIIETGGKQYKVEKGQILDIERIEEEEGSNVNFENVLLISDGETKIGTPKIEGALVSAKIVAHKRGEKIVVFKMKPKKRYKKTQGHRQELTTIEIVEIKLTGGTKANAKTSKIEDKKEEKAEAKPSTSKTAKTAKVSPKKTTTTKTPKKTA